MSAGYCPPQHQTDSIFNQINFLTTCSRGGGGGSVGPAGPAGATGPTGASGGGTSGLLSTTYTLTQAEMISLSPSSGIEIIPSPGVGKVIALQFINTSLIIVDPFSVPNTIGIRSPNAPYLQGGISISAGSYDNQFAMGAGSAGGSTSQFENQPISAYTYDPITLADGLGSTLTFQIYYSIYDL